MPNSIQHSFFFSHHPEVVWEYLTKAELIEQWLMQSDFQPVVGHDFQFRTKPLPNFNFNGIIYCKVLEVVPFEKLSYSWKGGLGGEKMTLDSIVTWTLQRKEEGTQLQLEHTGFKEADLMAYTNMSEGWLRNINKIDSLLNLTENDTNKD